MSTPVTPSNKKTAEDDDKLKAYKDASVFFERFDKSNLHDAAARRNSDWLLSEAAGLLDSPEYFSPLIKGLQSPVGQDNYTFLVPWPQALVGSKPLYCHDLHQITRELVEGIYVFNQLPSLSLEGNYDCTTACCIPSAYHDTLVGNTMLTVDYFIKSLLHGTTVSTKDKRGKILDEWKKIPSSKTRQVCVELGLSMMKDDEELGNAIYTKKKESFVRHPPKCIDSDLAQSQLLPRLSTSEDYGQQQDHISRDIFLRYLDHVSVGLVFKQKTIQQNGSYIILDPSFDVTTSVLATLKESNRSLYSHLHSYLQKQRDFILQHLQTKREMAYKIELLGYVSFMMTFLVNLKKHNKIIRESELQPRMSSRDVTDRELPPTLPSEESRWSPFTAENSYTCLHGGIEFHKMEQRVQPQYLSPEDLSKLQFVVKETKQKEVENDEKEVVIASKERESITKNDDKASVTESKEKEAVVSSDKEKELLMCELDGGNYYVLTLPLEVYYPKTPKEPVWVHAMVAELRSQTSRQPAVSDFRTQDQLKKLLGPRRVSAMKNVNFLLQASIEKGLLPAVISLLKRCTMTRLNKPDDTGMSLLHYAALNSRGDVISALVLSGCNVNQPVCDESLQPTETLPIHLAVQSGGLNAVCCQQHYGADLSATDTLGWAPIHYAAFHNYQTIVDHLVSVDKSYLDLVTSDKAQATPLLLAAQNGCFDTFTRLIDLGATVRVTDSSNCTAVHIAILQHHINIIQYLIDIRCDDVDCIIWDVFVEMLSPDSPSHAKAAGKCLDAITRKNLHLHSQVLKHNVVNLLVQLTKKEEPLQLVSVQVLANLSNIGEIKSALLKTDAVPNIVRLLSSSNDRIQACACIVLSDLGSNSQDLIAKAGAIPHLIKLLQSEQDDVQIYACACIGILASNKPANQKLVSESNGIPILVSQLQAKLSCIQGCAAHTLRFVIEGNRSNQLATLSENTIPLLVSLLRAKESSVNKAAATAIEALAENCSEVQYKLLNHKACINLLKRLLKMRDPSVKVCGGCALWAIAGDLISNKRFIASQIGLVLLVDMLTVNHEKLYYVCSEALGALASELGDNQSQISRVGGIKPLLDVLSAPTSQRVYLSVIRTLAALCVKPALVPNSEMQKSIVKSRGVAILASIISAQQRIDEIVRVEAACALAKLILRNPEGDSVLAKHKGFSYLDIFKFFTSSDRLVRLLAGYCISVMAFKNPSKEEVIKTHGSLNISNFTDFLESKDELFQVHAAFQVVLLSKLLTGVRAVDIAVMGIRLLVSLLDSDIESTKIQSAEFIASLAHSTGGIPDTLVLAGVLEGLMNNLATGNGPVVESCSVAIGYFTFNSTAFRLITGMFRDCPELFYTFKQHIGTIVVSPKFLTNWSYVEKIGLPALSLEIRGGPCATSGKRTQTAPAIMFHSHASTTDRPNTSTMIRPHTPHTSTVAHPRTSPDGRRSQQRDHSVTFGFNRKTQKQMEDCMVNVGVLTRRKLSLPSVNEDEVGLLVKRRLQMQQSKASKNIWKTGVTKVMAARFFEPRL